MISRREFLGMAGLAATALLRGADRPRPNIIFILADDLGYGDLSCFGQKMFATPNIDRLASEGMRFTNSYTGAAVCAPSRCCLMTGKHTGHSRIRANHGAGKRRISLQPDDVTVAEVLKQAGYRTGIMGKWGIGEAGTFGVPNDQGFDEWFGFLNQDQALHYYPNILWENDREVLPAGNQGAKRKDYAQKLFTDRALDFMKRNRDHPFFLYVPYTVPHPDSELGRDTGDGYVVPDYGPFAAKDWPKPEKGYAEMVHMLDTDVGKITSLVTQLGIESNTLMVFASDNGAGNEAGHHVRFFNSSPGMRGEKGELYEGGIRTPTIARWTGRIKPGQVNATPWAFWDFLPTAAELAGLPPPKDTDGISIVPHLFGQPAARTHEYLYWETYSHGFHQAARMGDWKALRHKNSNAMELYNLATDLGESHSLASQHPEIVAKMKAVMAAAHTDSPDYNTTTDESDE
ncbi:MAG TPA: arylsulfatase [Bryobacteraceae bacterium]|nr:arylsulfatase [Bryobacteraceae bacterium]